MKILSSSGFVVVTLLCATTFAATFEPTSERQTIEFEGKQWVTNLADEVTIVEHRGTTALRVRGRNDTYVYLADVEVQDGTIEVDIANEPRSKPGVGFRGCYGGTRYDKIVFSRRGGRTGDGNEVVEQAVVTRRDGTFVFLSIRIPERDDVGGKPNLDEWFHVKIVFHGKDVEVYLNGSNKPCIEVGAMFDDLGAGTLGVCGTGFCFANFRYTPSERVAAPHDRPAGEGDLEPK